MSTPKSRETQLKLGQFPLKSTPDEFAAHVRTQTDRWAEVIGSSHIEKVD